MLHLLSPVLKTVLTFLSMSSTSKFNPELLDFRNCVPACELSQIHPKLVDSLRSMQSLIGFPLRINSAFRPKSWELSKGRNGSSSHSKTPCLAVDLSARDSHCRYKIVCAAMYLGIPRIGVGKDFVHFDIDESKPHPILWHYYE